jgi:tetratricopeptide (TPR) repeat protein
MKRIIERLSASCLMVLPILFSAGLLFSADELNLTSLPSFTKEEVISYKAKGISKDTFYFGSYTSPKWGVYRKDIYMKCKGKSYDDMWEGSIEVRDKVSSKIYTGRFIGNLKDGWLKGYFTMGNDINKGRNFIIAAKAEQYKIKGKIWEKKDDTGNFEISLLSDAKELSKKEEERIDIYRKTAENSTDDVEKSIALGTMAYYYLGNNEKKLEDQEKALTYLEKIFKVNKVETIYISEFYSKIFVAAKKKKDKVLWDKYQKILEQQISESKGKDKIDLEKIKKANSKF